MQLRPCGQPQRYGESTQLVRDEATGEYLNYRQLMRHPMHHHTWKTSSANEFGQLAQGVGGKENLLHQTRARTTRQTEMGDSDAI